MKIHFGIFTSLLSILYRRIWLTAALSLSVSISSAQINFASANQRIDTQFNNFMMEGLFPGAAIMVSYNDTVIYSRGIGYADIEQKKLIDPFNSKFRIASITKIMTAVVMSQLSQEGKLDFNASPHNYLDSLAPAEYYFTIDNLGSHLAGLPRNPGTEKYACHNPYRRTDFYQVFKKDTLSEPLLRYSYSNYAYKMLGLIAEKVSGSHIKTLHKRYVIDHLNLSATFPDTGIYDDNTVTFYTKKQKSKFDITPCFDCSFMYAEGCYLSTAADLIKLGNALLFQNRLISKDQLTALVRSRKLSDGRSTGYGFGFNSEKDEFGNYYFGHNGLLPGARSVLKIYPNSKLVIVILTNSVVNDLDLAASHIARQYIREITRQLKNQ
jgi:serine beta-lactamase-like protein LACTB